MLGLLVLSAVSRRVSPAFTGLLLIVLALIPFYASFEHRRPQARELVPIAVLAAVAALGRVIFAPFPSVKPISAIVIVSGLAFGPEAGFMTGATAAICSNFFFGQGPFTPWQMFAWGMMGFTAGLLGRHKWGRRLPVLLVFGFLWGFLYGWLLDIYQTIAFVSPFQLRGVLLMAIASVYFDATHAVSNVVFLLLIAKPWMKLLDRVKVKYGLMEQ